MKKYVKLMAILVANVILSNCFAFSTSKPLLLTGYYIPNENNLEFYGFLSKSLDQGETWDASSPNVNLPPKNIFSGFSRIHCYATYCLGVGSYRSENVSSRSGQSQPLLAKSDESLTNWTRIEQIENLPNSLAFGGLSYLSCKKDNCVAVGDYTLESNLIVNKLLILTSKDAGKHWKFEPVESDLEIISLRNFSCGNDFCVIAADVRKSFYQVPVFFIRTINNSWIPVREIKDSPLPLDSVSLGGMSCSANYCVVIGTFLSLEERTRIALLVSDDKGVTWRSIQKIKNLDDLMGKESYLQQISCHDDTCLVAGGANHKPMLIESHDAGKTWMKVDLPANHLNLSRLKCTQSACIIAGVDTLQKAFVLFSKDDGYTWTLNQSIPVLSSSSYINSIYCNGSHCLLVGKTKKNFVTEMVILSSDDSGVTWKSVDKITNLPHRIDDFYLSFSD